MTRPVVLFLMAMSDLQGHSPIVILFRCDSCSL